jgi:hypothetical protein
MLLPADRVARTILAACLAAAFVLAGLACGDDEPSGPGGLGFGSARIGPAGGAVRTNDDNAAVLIPAGALDASTLISIRRLPEDSLPPALLAKRRVSETYRFGPDGQTFRVPVEVQIFFDADLLPKGVGLEDLTLGKLNPNGQIEELTNIHVLDDGQSIRLQATRRGVGGQISAFSPFAVWVDEADTGSVRVITTSVGARLDPDGYEVSVDDGPAGPVGVNDTLTVSSLGAGSHLVGLSGVAPNCVLQGQAVRPVEVVENQVATALFEVACDI